MEILCELSKEKLNEIRIPAYLALTYLARVDEFKMKILEKEKFLEKMIEAMSEDNDELVEASSGCLWNLSLYDEPMKLLLQQEGLSECLADKIMSTNNDGVLVCKFFSDIFAVFFFLAYLTSFKRHSRVPCWSHSRLRGQGSKIYVGKNLFSRPFPLTQGK